MFVCLTLKSEINIEVLGIKQEMKLSFAEGMIGCLPVFKTKESAEKHVKSTGKTIEILEISEVKGE